MHLHEELRAAREAAGLTQTELAARAGITRNQVVRAEKGGNITLDTLRKIAAHLPIEHLTLLEKLKLDFDYIPEPEKLYLGTLANVPPPPRGRGAPPAPPRPAPPPPPPPAPPREKKTSMTCCSCRLSSKPLQRLRPS